MPTDCRRRGAKRRYIEDCVAFENCLLFFGCRAWEETLSRVWGDSGSERFLDTLLRGVVGTDYRRFHSTTRCKKCEVLAADVLVAF